MQNNELNLRTLDPMISEISKLIGEKEKYEHQSYLSVLELLKLRLRVMITQREEAEEAHRYSINFLISFRNEFYYLTFEILIFQTV